MPDNPTCASCRWLYPSSEGHLPSLDNWWCRNPMNDDIVGEGRRRAKFVVNGYTCPEHTPKPKDKSND